MRDLPGLGIEPVSPALAGGFFANVQLGRFFKLYLEYVFFSKMYDFSYTVYYYTQSIQIYLLL